MLETGRPTTLHPVSCGKPACPYMCVCVCVCLCVCVGVVGVTCLFFFYMRFRICSISCAVRLNRQPPTPPSQLSTHKQALSSLSIPPTQSVWTSHWGRMYCARVNRKQLHSIANEFPVPRFSTSLTSTDSLDLKCHQIGTYESKELSNF